MRLSGSSSETKRKCRYCGKTYPSHLFRWMKKATGTYQTYECDKCCRKRFKRYNDRDLYNGEYRLKRVLRDAKWKAKKRGYDFTITLQDLLDMFETQGGKCALTGHHMTLASSDDLELRRYAASPDRIDNERGYTNDNVWLVCQHANAMKSSTDLEDFIDWCRAVTRTQE